MQTTTSTLTSADLEVTKTGPESVVPGAPISWTVTVSNLGPSDARALSVTDPVPSAVSGVQATMSPGSRNATVCRLPSARIL